MEALTAYLDAPGGKSRERLVSVGGEAAAVFADKLLSLTPTQWSVIESVILSAVLSRPVRISEDNDPSCGLGDHRY